MWGVDEWVFRDVFWGLWGLSDRAAGKTRVFGHQVKNECAHAHAPLSQMHIRTVTSPRGLLLLRSRMCMEEAKQACCVSEVRKPRNCPESVSVCVLVCIQLDIIQDKAVGSRQRGAGWPEGGLRVQRSKVMCHNFVCVRVNDGLEPLMQFNSMRKCALSISLQKQKETQKRCIRLLTCQYKELVLSVDRCRRFHILIYSIFSKFISKCILTQKNTHTI